MKDVHIWAVSMVTMNIESPESIFTVSASDRFTMPTMRQHARNGLTVWRHGSMAHTRIFKLNLITGNIMAILQTERTIDPPGRRKRPSIIKFMRQLVMREHQ